MKTGQIFLKSHGACGEVTGSKHLLTIGSDTIQLDGGMFQGRREIAYKKNSSLTFNPAEVHSLILSHGHFDHCGAIPLMVKNGFDGNIYATPASRDIANIIMMDSAHIQKRDYEYLLDKSIKKPDLKLYSPLYGTDEVLKALGQFITVNYYRGFNVLPGVKATFHDAGHILGSAMVELEIEGEVRVGFSGDLGRKHLPILRDPDVMSDLDYLILEGTYGNRLHDSIGSAQDAFARLVNRAASRRGKIIIPAFTIERTQELIYFLHMLLKNEKIPRIPIYVDSPMAVNATSIFRIHPECFDQETYDVFLSENIDPFGFDNIKYVTSVKESMEINDVHGSAIIISASGMAETGRILHHLKNNIENPANIIAIVGFMAEHTLGRKLVERQPSVKIFGEEYELKAEVQTLNAFSAHADYQEIKDWVSRYDLKRLKKIFLVHGEPESLAHLSGVLRDGGVRNVQICAYGDSYQLG